MIPKILVFNIVDSLSNTYSNKKMLAHNKLIISTLQEREATANGLLVSRESNIKQARTIYIAILAVLLTLLFSNKKENGRTNIQLVLIIIIILSYLIEVHSIDFLERENDCTNIISKSTEKIVNSNMLDAVWIKLDYQKYDREVEKASDGSFCRKLNSAVHPDIEQIGIYIVPFLFIYILFFINVIKQVKKRNT
ncbi:hypothetical protein LJE82_07960 [bacterium BMS3Abin03]|nr:hypothetical protein [bacterium BMS3Abin03]